MKQKVSLVLSGGGARGIAHIGVIEELERMDFEIVSITGTSMGALVGGIYALGKLDEYKTWLLTLDKLKVLKLVDFTISSQGLVKGERVFNELKKFIPDKKIEDLKISYAAVAVDILKKREVVLKSGSIYEAIRASIAIPTVFTPVRIGSHLLIDGGVLNNIPINHAKRLENDLLIAVNVNADIPLDKSFLNEKETTTIKYNHFRETLRNFQNRKPKVTPENKNLGYFNLIDRTISLMTDHITQTTIEKYPPDILIQIPKISCGTFDFYNAHDMIEIGRCSAKKILKDIRV